MAGTYPRSFALTVCIILQYASCHLQDVLLAIAPEIAALHLNISKTEQKEGKTWSENNELFKDLRMLQTDAFNATFAANNIFEPVLVFKMNNIRTDSKTYMHTCTIHILNLLTHFAHVCAYGNVHVSL
jgi:hypothetical protein